MDLVFIVNLVIGIVAGVLAGMFGIGGGVVIVPALIIFSNFSQVQANGTSLAALLLPVGILAVIEYYRAGYINIRIALLIALGILAGVVFGSMLALSIPTVLLKTLYGLFLLYVSWTFISPKEMWQKYVLKIELPPKEKPIDHSNDFPFYFFLAIGILAGVLAGMFGIGGGLVIVPLLMAFLNYGPKKAAGTSLGALMLPVGLPGVIMYHNAGQLNISYAIPVAIGLLIGAVFGAKITIMMPSAIVKRIYGLFLLIMGINFILRSFLV